MVAEKDFPRTWSSHRTVYTEKAEGTHGRWYKSIAVGVQEQLRPGVGFLGESDRIRLNGRSAECLRNYLTIINRHINGIASVQP